MTTFSPTPARPITPKPARRLCTLFGTAMPIALAIEAAAGTADIDAASGNWTTAAPLPEERTEFSVSTDGERLFLLGGFAADPSSARARRGGSSPTTLPPTPGSRSPNFPRG